MFNNTDVREIITVIYFALLLFLLLIKLLQHRSHIQLLCKKTKTK